jgi:NADH-quinone oxidoreductase subunit C
MATDLNMLYANLNEAFSGKVVSLENRLGELTLVVKAGDMIPVFTRLRDDADLRFEELVDVCGIDYSTFGSELSEDGKYLPDNPGEGARFSSDVTHESGLVSTEVGQAGIAPHGASSQTRKARFAAVYHLLSITHNIRLRVRVFAEDDDMPILDSVTGIWPSANWFEREAFDLYGIIFVGHPDLRRILTDYGFVGNPFRKDFPLSGHVEMRYDAAQKRVVYEPVTVDPRQITPRTMREENYGRH